MNITFNYHIQGKKDSSLHDPLAKDLVQQSMKSHLWNSLDIIPRVFINLIDLSSSKNNLIRLQPLRLLKELPETEDDWEDGNHEIGEQEVGDVPFSFGRVSK
jgi:hypothetical protein